METLVNSIKKVVMMGIFMMSFSGCQTWTDYASGCLSPMAISFVGIGLADSQAKDGKISTSGYAIGGGVSCLIGIGYTSYVKNSTSRRTETKTSKEVEELDAVLQAKEKERCLLLDRCEAGGAARVKTQTVKREKQGGKVIEYQTSEIELND